MILFNYLLMCAIFGTTFLAIKVGIDAGAAPFFSAGVRFVVAGLLLFLWMLWKRKADVSLLLRKELWLTGACLTFGTFSTLYWAEQHVSSGLAAILSATGPMMILLLQATVLRERLTTRSIIGCIVGFAGVFLLVVPSLTVEASLLWLLGCVLILIGEFSYSAGTLYSRRVIARFNGTSPIAMNAVQMMAGGILLLVLSFFTEKVSLDSMLTPNAILSLLYLIVAGSMMGHTIYYWLVAKTNPVFPSTWLYVSPPIAMGLGALLYGEQVSWIALVGVMTVVAGIVLVNLDVLKPLLAQAGRRRTLIKTSAPENGKNEGAEAAV